MPHKGRLTLKKPQTNMFSFIFLFNIPHPETQMVTDEMVIDTNCEIFDD